VLPVASIAPHAFYCQKGLATLTVRTGPIAASERLRRIDVLDLEPIVYTLMHPEPGEIRLTLVDADRCIALYRCFLKLCVLYPGVAIVPTRQLDHVWHAHMLDTAKYRADCDHVLGRFLDHFPYAGLRGQHDRRAWREDFTRTRRLFRELFGVEIGAEPAASACSNHGDGSDCCTGCVKPPTADARPRPVRSTARARSQSLREGGTHLSPGEPDTAVWQAGWPRRSTSPSGV
jgi:hypothetical protein